MCPVVVTTGYAPASLRDGGRCVSIVFEVCRCDAALSRDSLRGPLGGQLRPSARTWDPHSFARSPPGQRSRSRRDHGN